MRPSQEDPAPSAGAAPEPGAPDPLERATGYQPPEGARPQRTARRLSRRSVLLGLAGLGLAGCVFGRLAYVLAHSHALYTYRGHAGEIQALAWSPDSQRIASTDGEPFDVGTLHVWDALSGEHMQTLPVTAGVQSVAWSPNGKYLATGSWDRTASVWEVATGQKLLTYDGHGQLQDHASASFQARSVAGSIPETRALVLHRPTSAAPQGIIGLAWSPDSTRLLSTGGDDTSQVWEALTGQTLLTFGSQLDFSIDAAWSPDGQHLLMRTDRGVQVQDATSGALQFTFPIDEDDLHGPASWSPDGKHVASTNFQIIHLWELVTGRQVLTYDGHSDTVVVVAWSPDSRRLASAGFDLTVRVWEAANGQTEYTYLGHKGLIQAFFSERGPTDPSQAPESTRAGPSVQDGPVVRSASALLPQDTAGPTPSRIAALAWAPNGRYIASGSTDATVQVWQPG